METTGGEIILHFTMMKKEKPNMDIFLFIIHVRWMEEEKSYLNHSAAES